MDFTKLKAVKAEPPASAGRAAAGKSPLQAVIQLTIDEQGWRSYAGVPLTVVATKVKRKSGTRYDVREIDILVNELKRAARQMEVGLQVRVTENPEKGVGEVYFMGGEKRHYNRNGDSDEGAGGENTE